MAEEKVKSNEIIDAIAKIFIKLQQLEVEMNNRFDKLKAAVIDYINLSSEMTRGSVIAHLKAI